jgi:hypothetical protein
MITFYFFIQLLNVLPDCRKLQSSTTRYFMKLTGLLPSGRICISFITNIDEEIEGGLKSSFSLNIFIPKKILETRFSIGNQKKLMKELPGNLVFNGGLWDPTSFLAKLVLDLFLIV